jgi:GT2 family glycosyltransferase/glycosyltransferase involved in cell wall biosynthesis
MLNILFVLYHDFSANSAVHVHHFANNLVKLGFDCVVAVPNNKNSVFELENHLYKVTEFTEIDNLTQLFNNQQGPDIVHGWTPREVVRKYCQQIKSKFSCKLFIHLEDNEEYLLEKFLNQPLKKLLQDRHLQVPDNLAHPIRYQEFLAEADGITIIVDELKKFIPSQIPTLTLPPGADTELFFPREGNRTLAASLGIPSNSTVLCYTGNVHTANAHEVRSIYLAVAMLNREGQPTVLIRTGRDFCEFLGSDDGWAKKHSIEMGYVDRTKLPEIIALADILVQPGQADNFNIYRFPSKLPEFLAMGKPVILPKSNIGNFIEHMQEAIVLPVVDAFNICHYVNLLIKDNELKQRLGNGALNFAKNHLNWYKNSESLKSFYESLIAVPEDWERKQQQKEIIKLSTELQQTQAEFRHSQQQLQQTQAEFRHSQQQLQQTQAELVQSQSQLRQTQARLGHLETLIGAMETSKFWQARQFWYRLRRAVNLTKGDELYQSYRNYSVSNQQDLDFNPSSQLDYRWERIKEKGWEYILLKLLQDKLPQLKKSLLEPESIPTPAEPDIPRSSDSKYQQWLNKNYPKKADLGKMAQTAEKLAYKPLISVIVPLYNPPEEFLREAIESVRQQVYPHWELCLADDRSTQPYIKSILEEYARKDSRIKVVFREENGHISRASNSAIAIAEGEFIALLDHDDLLSPHALYEVALLLNEHPEADMVYSDEDKIDERNLHKDPFFKMDWCPDSFLSRMYTCHLGVYRRSLVNEIGNFRVGFEGSQDYDLVLRITEKTEQIFHIPKILYHWRIHSQSVAADAGAKLYAYEASNKALSEALIRRGEKGRVIPKPGFPGLYTIRYEIEKKKLVSIIIPTKDLAKTLNTCLKSIFEKSTYYNYEVIVIDNGSREKETFKCFDYWQKKEPERFKCFSYDIPFNYSQINNYAVRQAEGDYLLFLNNDTEVITEDWIEGMVEQAQRPSIGAVGALLLYPDKTIQHAGVVLGIGGVAGHSHKYLPSILPGYLSQAITTNNYSAVTGACLMCRREVFEEVGGFEERLTTAFNDIDLCLKMIERGYRNIYLPHVVLYHYESKSRGQENTPEKQARFQQEINYMKQKWQLLLDNDPCYNPHLSKNSEDYSINV